MNTVQRWDIYDIADELEDVVAQLRTGLIVGYDPVEHLKELVSRTWDASRRAGKVGPYPLYETEV